MQFFNKEEKLISITKNKKVLHLGCVGFADSTSQERIDLAKKSLHFTLTNISQVTGIDYCREAIDYFKKNDVFDNVLYGDVEKLNEINLNEIFDVVVAGDIIEHISNPGLMLDGIKLFCDSNTEIAITTPHAFGLLNYLRFIMGRFKEGKEHLMTFNIQNIENLLGRHNYKIISIDTCHQKQAIKKGLLFHIGRVFFNIFPKFGGTLFIIAKIETNES